MQETPLQKTTFPVYPTRDYAWYEYLQNFLLEAEINFLSKLLTPLCMELNEKNQKIYL
jgi:hypothetical protein